MKKTSAAFLIVMAAVLMGGKAFAYVIADNPDQKMSFGFNYARASFSGDYQTGNFIYPGSESFWQNSFNFDVRAPITSFLTLYAGGGYSNSNSNFSVPVFQVNQTVTLSGPIFNAGFRIYIP